MPVNHGESRIIEEEETDEWVEERSQEINQYYNDEGLDQVIAELRWWNRGL